MKFASIACSLLLALSVAHGNSITEPAYFSSSQGIATTAHVQHNFSIRVADGNWGEVKPEEVEILLNAIAADMLAHFPGRRLAPIEVFPTNRRPVVLYEKGPENQYQVYLAAKDRHWGEYIYEFSHELFHILANYENHALSGGARHLWFEETLCEAVSLHNLKRMSMAWQESVPHAEWVSYTPALNRFTRRALNEPHRRLPENTSLGQWLREHEATLLGNPHLRAKNEMVAMRLLPLLEQSRDWSAVNFLNPPFRQATDNFYDHLAAWYGNTPAAHRDFVIHTMNLFEFHPPEPAAYAATGQQHQRSPVGAASDPDAYEAGAAGSIRRMLDE